MNWTIPILETPTSFLHYVKECVKEEMGKGQQELRSNKKW